MAIDKKLIILNFNVQEKKVTEFVCRQKPFYRMAYSQSALDVTDIIYVHTGYDNVIYDDERYKLRALVLAEDPEKIFFEKTASVTV